MAVDTIVEIIGIVLSLVYVLLASKQIKWCWIAGGLGSAVYVYLNFKSQLVYDGILQIYYVIVAVYGIVLWNKQDNTNQFITVTKLPFRLLLILLLLGVVLTGIFGFIAKVILHQNTAYLDAGVTAFSFIATWMTARKYIENWLFWVVIDLVAAVMYYIKDLQLTAGLYVVFTFIAAYAYWQWYRDMQQHTRTIAIRS